jgi:probable F420-dependent oxidoreductase
MVGERPVTEQEDTRMQFGVHLPTYWSDYGQSGIGMAIEAAAKAAETLGYASVWANDHVIAPGNQTYVVQIIEPLTTLASLIHLVPGLALGTSTLVLPQRNAIVVAKQAAALDVLSGGRFILGIGVGWLREEFAFLGADFDRRGDVADEAIQAMHALWREERASFHGQFYHFDDALFYPKPLSEGPPLWMCGNTRPMIRRAARLGDAWNPFGIGLEEFKAGVAYLREQAQARAVPMIAAHLRIRIGESTNDQAHIAGDIDTVTRSLDAYRQRGLAYLICDFVADGVNDLLRQMELMAQHIMPRLTE